jgi:hypothetical protein
VPLKNRLGIAEPGGGVYQFHRGEQLVAADGKIRMVVGHHIGLVEAGERVIVNIFEQSRTSDRQGLANDFQEIAQWLRQPGGHFSFEKRLGDPVVGFVGHG